MAATTSITNFLLELKNSLYAIFDYKLIIVLVAVTVLFFIIYSKVYKAQIFQIGILGIGGFILLKILLNTEEVLKCFLIGSMIVTLVVLAKVKIASLGKNKKNGLLLDFRGLIIVPALLFYNMTDISYYKIIRFIQQNFVVLWQMLMLGAIIVLLLFLITGIINAKDIKLNRNNVLNENLVYIIGGLPFFVRMRQKLPKTSVVRSYKEKEENNIQNIQEQGVETLITPCKNTNYEEKEENKRTNFYTHQEKKFPKIKVVKTEKKLSPEERVALDAYLADENTYKITYIKGELFDAEKTGNSFPKDADFEKLPHHPAIFKLGEKNINRSLTSTIPSQAMEQKHKFLVVTWGSLTDIDGKSTNVITKYWQKSYTVNEIIYVSEDLILKYLLTNNQELNKKNKKIIDEKTETHIRWLLERPAVEEQQKIQNEANLKKIIEEKLKKKSLIKNQEHKKKEAILAMEKEKRIQERRDKLEKIREQEKLQVETTKREERLKQLHKQWTEVIDETSPKSGISGINQPLFPKNNKNNKDETEL